MNLLWLCHQSDDQIKMVNIIKHITHDKIFQQSDYFCFKGIYLLSHGWSYFLHSTSSGWWYTTTISSYIRCSYLLMNHVWPCHTPDDQIFMVNLIKNIVVGLAITQMVNLFSSQINFASRAFIVPRMIIHPS